MFESALTWHVSPLEVAVRLGIALAAGALLGLERERKNKPAGLKTHMLVALGAALFSVLALELFWKLQSVDASSGADPIRAISAIVGGIGFLGAGAIIRSGSSVRGVTTAATIWIAGALGVACGTGEYIIASVGAGLAVLTLLFVGSFERKVLGTKGKGAKRRREEAKGAAAPSAHREDDAEDHGP